MVRHQLGSWEHHLRDSNGWRCAMNQSADIRYTKSGNVSLAYQTFGAGDTDLVLAPGYISNLEANWEEPNYARFLERLASRFRVVLFDKRGTGLSDRIPAATLEERADDV